MVPELVILSNSKLDTDVDSLSQLMFKGVYRFYGEAPLETERLSGKQSGGCRRSQSLPELSFVPGLSSLSLFLPSHRM